jgi:hypothetical protein
MRMLSKIKQDGYQNQSAYLRFIIEKELANKASTERLELLINTRTDELKASIDSLVTKIFIVSDRLKKQNIN